MIYGIFPGTFDLLHAGHILALKEAREQCQFLAVLLQTDPTLDRADKNKPIQTLQERRIQLEGCRYVDDIIEYQTEEQLYFYMKENKHAIYKRFLGADWEGKAYTGCDISEIEHVFISRNHSFSSTELRKRIAQSL